MITDPVNELQIEFFSLPNGFWVAKNNLSLFLYNSQKLINEQTNIKVYNLLVASENLGRPELFGWKSQSFPRCSILYDMMSTRHSQHLFQVLISEVRLVDRRLQIKYHIRETTA